MTEILSLIGSLAGALGSEAAQKLEAELADVLHRHAEENKISIDQLKKNRNTYPKITPPEDTHGS